MAPSTPIVAALFRLSSATLDEQSMLQMPVIEKNVATDSSECACPGYYEAACLENADKGCIWGNHDNSNAPWCGCDEEVWGSLTPPIFTPPSPPPVDPNAQAPAASCPSGWVQKGDIGADIGGCGLQSCGERYDISSAEACAERCDSNSACVGFSFAPMNGDRNHPGVSACTIYDSDSPTGTWTGTQGIATQVMCGRPTVRIAGGGDRGRLEILHNGEWGTICDDLFGPDDAMVACRQMGYDRGLGIQSFGGGSGQIWMDNVGCTGDESMLENCAHNGWNSHNCGHHEDVGVHCFTGPVPPIELRIAGGGSRGRLEIRYDGMWGTICDDHFDMNDAQVACRQMGFSQATESIQSFGGGEGQIWLDNLGCAGTEAAIQDCSHIGFGNHNCGHTEDIGVACA